MAEWHATAKLRMHTSSTINRLRLATEYLGTKLRYFQKHISPLFHTKELPREEAARVRRRKKTGRAGITQTLPSSKLKTLNLLTYKLHALGDYAAQVLRFGTTDSYSTQPVR